MELPGAKGVVQILIPAVEALHLMRLAKPLDSQFLRRDGDWVFKNATGQSWIG